MFPTCGPSSRLRASRTRSRPFGELAIVWRRILFRGVRLRLTLLYLFAAMALIMLLGGGTYALVSNYFRTSTDLALQVRMAQELQLLGHPLPAELVSASRQWISSRVSPTVTVMAAPAGDPLPRGGHKL